MEIIKFFIQFRFAKRSSFSFASDSFPTIRHCAPYKSVLLLLLTDIVLVLVIKISLRYTLQEIHKIHNKLTVSLYITSFTAGMHSCCCCITVLMNE